MSDKLILLSIVGGLALIALVVFLQDWLTKPINITGEILFNEYQGLSDNEDLIYEVRLKTENSLEKIHVSSKIAKAIKKGEMVTVKRPRWRHVYYNMA